MVIIMIRDRAQSETNDLGDLVGRCVRSEDMDELLCDVAFGPGLEMVPEGFRDCFARLRRPGIHGLLGIDLEFERGVLDLQTTEWWPLFPRAYPPKMVFQMRSTVV